MPTKPKRKGLGGLGGLARKPKSSMMTPGISKSIAGHDKIIKKLREDLKDAKKKLSVHQDPKSKSAASLRSLLDQPRKKVRSPHKDKKKSKYADAFKRKSKKP